MPILGSSPKTTSSSSATNSKKYETVSYSPKTGKQSTSFGILWIPTKKRNKKKEMAYSAMNYDKKSDVRGPSMYSYGHMSGDSPDFQLNKKKEEESNLLMPERLKGPIATVASAGSVATAIEAPSEVSSDSEEKLLKHDDDKKNPEEGIKEKDYLENNELSPKSPESKHTNSSDKVDSAYNPSAPIKPPLQPEPTWEEEDCGIKCLYYTLQCCDCVLM